MKKNIQSVTLRLTLLIMTSKTVKMKKKQILLLVKG